MRTRIAMFVVVLLGVCIWGGSGACADGPSLNAPDNHSVLILDTTVVGGTACVEAVQAPLVGLTPVVVDSSQWASMTASNFATYRAIVLGDHQCGGDYSAAAANVATWRAVVNGDIILIGSDPEFHARYLPGPVTLIKNSVGFAGAAANKTGLYFAFGCQIDAEAVVTILHALSPGGFGARGASYDSCHIVATHPALASLTDADLSNWGTSVHAVFTNVPSDYIPLAVAADESFTNNPPPTGEPYILVQGQGVVPIGDCSLSAVIAQIQGLDLRQSEKTALIRTVTLLHDLLAAVKCHTALHLEKAFTTRMQKSLRLGRVDITTMEELQACINQFIGTCPDSIDRRAHR